MGVVTKAGICPKCGGSNTCVDVRQADDDGTYIASCHCFECGYEDFRYRGEDVLTLVDIARRLFSTVYVNGSDEVKGLPTVNVLADDISMLLRIICSKFDCPDCPMHESEGDDGVAGSVIRKSRIGLRCRDQGDASCARLLRKAFPALEEEF